MAWNNWQLGAFAVVIPSLIVCAVYALIAARRRQKSAVASLETVDEFAESGRQAVTRSRVR